MRRGYDDIDDPLQVGSRRNLRVAHVVAGIAAAAAAAYTALGPLADDALVVRFNLGLIFGSIAFAAVHLVHLIAYLIWVEILVRCDDREIASHWPDLISDPTDPRD